MGDPVDKWDESTTLPLGRSRNAFAGMRWDGGCYWLPSDVSTFQVQKPPRRVNHRQASGQEPARLFCARLFFRGIASLNSPLYDLFVLSRPESEIVLRRRCCMRRRATVPQPLILLDTKQQANPPSPTVVLSRSTHE
jgi:hypothetical protein